MRKICLVTGSRSEYGLLSRLMRLISEDSELTLQIIATNMHLSPEFGLTYREIEKDGFTIDKKVEMLLSSDTPNAISKSVGLATIGFADAYEDLKPNLLLVLGDRHEILAAVTASLFYKIPVAHIHGGEISEGAYDNAIRHAITKMSHLHFTSTIEYRNRVIQLGEEPDKVFYVGALGLDNLKHLKLLSKEELEKKLKFQFGIKCVLVTIHPVTLENNAEEDITRNLLNALDFFKDLKIIFTFPNSDTNGRIIIQMINQFVKQNESRCVAFSSLGQINYLSALQFVSVVIGNSSSGLIEVPSFGIPTLNIGNRQQGRISSSTVINCGITVEDIREKLIIVLSDKFKESCKSKINPYEKSNTAFEILEVIKQFDLKNLIQKKFYKV